MQISVDQDNNIINYAVIGALPDGIEVKESKVPAKFLSEEYWPRKWRFEDGKIRLSGIPNPYPPLD